MLNVVSSEGMLQWQEVYLPDGMGNGHRATSQMLVLLMGQYGALTLMAVPKRNNEHNEQTIIGMDVASTEMVVSVWLTSEFCELGCIGLTWYERVGCGSGVGSMARACWFYEGALW